MGTPDFAVPSLRTLLADGFDVVGVVTQPDRPKGRKRVLTPPPVKDEALKHGIPVFQPEKLRSPEAIEAVRAMAPDLIVTAAYGQILPKSILELPKHRCINVHASLLPKYRGGAPIHHAVMRGESVTGVTIMYMEAGLDTGDMLAKVELPITDDDTTGTLFEKLSIAGAELLHNTLPELLAGRLVAEPQREEDAVYSPNVSRTDEEIDWSRSARAIFNHVRGLNPFPGAYTWWNGDVFKIWRCREFEGGGAAEPGTVSAVTGEGIVVQTGNGKVLLTEIQPAGKKAMPAADFARGGSIAAGERFIKPDTNEGTA